MANHDANSMLSGAFPPNTSVATSSTWLERLLLNLVSYSIVILPTAFIVIATKLRLFPQAISTSTLIRYFVYGSGEIKESAREGNIDGAQEDNKLLLDDKNAKAPPVARQKPTTNASSAIEFLWCFFGLQISYLMWGVLQEKIMTTKYPVASLEHTEKNASTQDLTRPLRSVNQSISDISDQWITFHDSQFLVLINRVVAFLTAILALVYTKRRSAQLYANRYANGGVSTLHLARTSTLHNHTISKPQAPLYKYIYCSMSNILSSWCQYEALKYVNFPTQCLSKSCKVIPTMLMAKILLRKRHPFMDYFCALLLATGMFIFMLNQSDSRKPGSYEEKASDGDTTMTKLAGNSAMISGLIILSLYLTFDSFTSNWQQSLYSEYDISNWQMMAAINFYSILLTLTSLHQLGSLRPAFHLLGSSKVLLRDCLVMSITSSMGQIFVYYTIKRFGSVLFSVMMTLRQFLSILLSCLIYKHKITFGSSLGLLLVLLVVAYQTWLKMSGKSKGGKRVEHPLECSQENLIRRTHDVNRNGNHTKLNSINS